MDGSGGGREKSTRLKPPKFQVYQNPAISAALTSSSLRPSASTFTVIICLLSASVYVLLYSITAEKLLVAAFGNGYHNAARVCAKLILIIAGLLVCGTLLALIKAISQWKARYAVDVMTLSPSKGTKESTRLSNRQLSLIGLKPKVELASKESSNKPPKSRTASPSPSNVLVPLHQLFTGSNQSTRMSSGSRMQNIGTPSTPYTHSMYLVPASSSLSPAALPASSQKTSPGTDQFIASPWSSKRPTFHNEITTEEEFQNFLADIDLKISEAASKWTTPPPSINGFGLTSPNTVANSVNTSGTTKSTPLRPVRMSPASKKFTTPPKKGEGDLPPPMSLEDSIKTFKQLGIYPQIEQWRDRLRQWFSAILLYPLLQKIETSHLKVMEAAAKLGLAITVSQIGNGSPIMAASSSVISPIERTSEWKATYVVDEDDILHQLRATLAQVQAPDASMLKSPMTNFQLSAQHATSSPAVQEAIDAIAEHQRLHSLMKGEWCKNLIPYNSIRAHSTVQRIRELAEGTCLKNFEYLGSGEVVQDNVPSDSHLLLYLFFAFLEHPNWMLHVDPTYYSGAQPSKNPLFLGVLPPKESFPAKYIGVVSGSPSILHSGACILAVGKQSIPGFTLYWNKSPQFSLQGRTALWDSILLLCHQINTKYDGIVRGMHLGSPALNILSVFNQETDG